MTCANSAPPLELAWENVTVSNDGRAVARGIAFGIGSPQQIVSLRPDFAEGNTWIFNAADCVNDRNDSCIGQKGGVFDRTKSNTFVPTTKAQWNGSTQSSSDDDLSFIYFNDDVRIGRNGLLHGFPLLLDQPGKGTQSGLNLGPNSTFIDAVVDSGLAPSKRWGLWAGSRSVTKPENGALIVGGYDKNRVTGQFTTFPVARENCITCVNVTRLTYDVNGVSTSLFPNAGDTIEVGLNPFDRTLQFHPLIFNIFWPLVTNLTTRYGGISIQLSNGYSTSIPSTELWTPELGWDDNGVWTITNSSIDKVLIVNHTDDYVPVFGLPFFTMNYLTMDYEGRKFQLAPAAQGASGDVAAQALCSGVIQTPTPAPPPTPEPSHKSNTGAIVGGVVGGVAALVIIGALIFFLMRRRRRARGQQEGAGALMQGNPTANDRHSLHTTTTQTEVSELAQNNHVDQWLYTQREPTKTYDSSDMGATMNAPFEMPAHAYR